MTTTIQYGHWGITVSTRSAPHDYAPTACEFFPYPVVNGRGPMDSAETERQAIARCRELGGEVKGPFFVKNLLTA